MRMLKDQFRYAALLAIAAFGLLAGGTGCSAERYYCDDTGCYYCDGLGCRQAPAPAEPVLCSGPEDCPSGQVCLDGTCSVDPRPCGELGCDCSESGMCGAGFVCSDGECRADEDACRFNHQCGADRVCIDGSCLASCDADRLCPETQMCEEGRCVDTPITPGECAANADCATGQVCLDSICIDGCSADTDCGEGRFCEAGVCRVDDRPRPFCSADSDCRPGHPCVDGVCRTTCDTHQDCLRFDAQFGFCLENLCVTTNEATSNCSTSTDCEAGQECSDGICR